MRRTSGHSRAKRRFIKPLRSIRRDVSSGVLAFSKMLQPFGRMDRESGLFGFWLRFGSVTGFLKPAPSPKPRQKPKILAPNWLQLFFKRFGIGMRVHREIYFFSSQIAQKLPENRQNQPLKRGTRKCPLKRGARNAEKSM